MTAALAIHGGAGTVDKARMTPELEAEYRLGLELGLNAGWKILNGGGSALDSVEAAVIELENFPLFNAGRGAVFTHEGEQEMDAAIMNGATSKAGAVARVKNIRNPVALARLVMEASDHVLISGEGAEEFADQNNVATEPDEYFFTEHRWLQLQECLVAGRVQLDHAASPSLGTVGAVACDSKANLAAATSTGGMTNKKYGRIGDTPLIGAGTYADKRCAVSCTGHGEYFILGVTAHDVAARMEYKGLSLNEAARQAIGRLTELEGEGGLIAVDADGKIAMSFNSGGMYRASISSSRKAEILIYRD